MTPVLLRRLPITLAPVHRETVNSFTRRLAVVNHLNADDLADTVATSVRKVNSGIKRTFNAENFASITGHSADKLTRALPDLRSDPGQLLRHRALQACPRCSRRHRGGTVMLYLPDHQHVCIRHNIWLGSLGPNSTDWIRHPGPIDVSAVPAIRAAQRRHHRIVRRHGQSPTSHAVGTAVATWDYIHRSSRLGRRQWERLNILRPGADSVSKHDPLAHAVYYPEIITIANILASPHWQSAASESATTHNAYAEIARRLTGSDEDRYLISPAKRHPLTYWSEELQSRRRTREREEHRSSPIIRRRSPSREPHPTRCRTQPGC